MPTLDHENGLAPGYGPTDEQVHVFFRQFLPDFYFVNTPLSRMRRHLAFINNLPKEPIQIDFYRPPGARFTELTLCAHDELQPGLLSKVAGTLTALKINVHTAWIHTLANPSAPQSGQRVVLDTLILSETYFRRTRPLTLKTQKLIRQVLSDVLNGQADVDFLMARNTRRAQQALDVCDLAATDAGPYTLVKFCSSDDEGLLYRVTRVLSGLNLDIRHAQINTQDRSVDDVFFLTNESGEPLSEEEMGLMLERIRQKLSSDGITN